MAEYPLELFRIAHIPVTGRFGFFIDLDGREGFVEAERLPTGTLIAITAAADLPNVHALVAGVVDTNGVNLHDAREAVIAQLKALAVAQSGAGDVGGDHYSSLSLSPLAAAGWSNFAPAVHD